MEIIKRSNLTKHQVLHWFGACLRGNISRKKVIELSSSTDKDYVTCALHILLNILYIETTRLQ